jgi:hypothetical protein
MGTLYAALPNRLPFSGNRYPYDNDKNNKAVCQVAKTSRFALITSFEVLDALA